MFEDEGIADFLILLLILDKEQKRKELIKSIFNYLVDKFYLGRGLWRDYHSDKMQKTAHSKYLGEVLKFLVCFLLKVQN